MKPKKVDKRSLRGLINLLGGGTVGRSFIYNLLGISIDGTDITGATIDGTDVQEITIDGNVAWRRLVTDGLKARYNFEQDFKDSYNSNDATAQTSFTYSTDSKVNNHSAEFDDSSYATTGYSQPDSSWSISVWFNTTYEQDQYSSPFMDCISSNTSGTKVGMAGTHHGDGEGELIWHSGSGGDTRQFVTPSTWNDGNWHHAVFTYSDSNGPEIYVDGESKATASHTQYDTTANWYIGRGNKQTDRYYQGKLDDLRFYTKELSSTQVSKIYNNTN